MNLSKVSLFALFLGLLVSCGGRKMPQIPNTANAVITVDLKKILGKSTDMIKILKDKKFLENFPESESFAEVLPLLLDGSFDDTQRMYFYTNADAKKPENAFLGMHILLKDEKKWAESAQKAFKIAPKKAENLSYIYKKPLLLAWKNNILWGAIGDKSENELLKNVNAWSAISVSESFGAKNPIFTETQKNTHDIQFWINTQNATDALSMYFLPNNVKNQAKDDIIGANFALNFESGAINMEIFTYFMKGKSEKYARLIRTNLDKSVLNDNPVANPKVFLSTALNMEGIIAELKKDKDFEKEARNFKKDTGTELFSVLQNVTGDLAFALENIDFSKIFSGKIPTFSTTIKIKDRKIFDDMMRNERTSETFKKIADNTYQGRGTGSEESYVYIEKDMLHVINGKQLLEKIKAEKGELGKNNLITSITQNQNMVLYFDLVQLLKNTKEISGAFEPIEKSLKGLALTVNGVQKDKDLIKAQVSLAFQDAKTNAIPALYDLYLKTQEANKKAEKEAEEKRKKRKEMEKESGNSEEDFEKFLKEGEGKLEKPSEEL